MTFTRNVAASGNQEKAISIVKGKQTWFSCARGDGDTTWGYHKANRAKFEYDVSSGQGSSSSSSGPAAFYAHMVCMSLAWGMLLPWGVSIASRSRKVDGAAQGAWFHTHKTLQYMGWFLQIVGFVMAILYVGEKGGGHFNGYHAYIGLAVVVLGTLQPLNAAFRMHPPDGGWPGGVIPFKRKLFEWVHKGGGYLAVAFGMVNVVIGVMLTRERFGWLEFGLALGLAVIGIAPVTVFFIVSTMNPSNRIAKMCVRAQTHREISYDANNMEDGTGRTKSLGLKDPNRNTWNIPPSTNGGDI
jgi:hypothetical protein